MTPCRIALLAFASLIASPATSAKEWTALPDDPDYPGVESSIDLAMVQYAGDHADAWFLMDYDSPQPVPGDKARTYRSFLLRLRVDCPGRRLQPLIAEIYAEPGGAGTQILRKEYGTDSPFDPVKSVTMRRAFELICPIPAQTPAADPTSMPNGRK